MYRLIYVNGLSIAGQQVLGNQYNFSQGRGRPQILFSLRANVIVVGDLVQLNKVFLLVLNSMPSFVVFKNQTHPKH